jgi:alpha-tubulin suppressor-like RCC1 family protein
MAGWTQAERTRGETRANEFRQLGDGSTTASMRPVSVPTLTDVAAVDAGGTHTCARRTSGEIVCWGDNRQGQLGDGSVLERTTLASTDIEDGFSLSVGGFHSCVARRRAELVCWGGNYSGQVGDGTMMDRSSPVPVIGL